MSNRWLYFKILICSIYTLIFVACNKNESKWPILNNTQESVSTSNLQTPQSEPLKTSTHHTSDHATTTTTIITPAMTTARFELIPVDISFPKSNEVKSIVLTRYKPIEVLDEQEIQSDDEIKTVVDTLKSQTWYRSSIYQMIKKARDYSITINGQDSTTEYNLHGILTYGYIVRSYGFVL